MAVNRVEITSRQPFAQGRLFGDAGAFEILDGIIHFEVSPEHLQNSRIVDLEHGERNATGSVVFSADFTLVAPKDPAKANGRLVVDVPNRGNPLVAATFHRVPAVMPEDRRKPGDGFLFEQGFTTLCIGWQWDAEGEGAIKLTPPFVQEAVQGDVMMKLHADEDRPYLALVQLGQTAPPYPVADLSDPEYRLYVKAYEGGERTLIDRSRWSFAKKGQVSERHITLQGGFKRGMTYELVYKTTYCPIVGSGLLAIRDAAACLKYQSDASPLAFGFSHCLAFGVSQTGRLLRQFLFEGLNADENNRKVFDGMYLHIAGAQRGDFNHRFAQPTVATVPSLGQRYPFAITKTPDLYSDDNISLCENLRADLRPRVIIANTSFEYWRGDASLAHISGDVDLPADDLTRIYSIAGTHHIGGILIGGKQLTQIAATGLKVAMPLNVVNAGAIAKALLIRLDEWVTQDIAPPADCHPRLDDGTAITRDAALDQFRDTGVPLLAPEKLPGIRHIKIDATERTQADQPVPEGERYPVYVSALDEDLNELAGVRLPDLTVPLGTHTGWNPKAGETGAGDQPAIFAGFTRFFAPQEIVGRYTDEAGYLEQVDAAIEQLVADKMVLTVDKTWLRQLASDRYRAAMGTS